ncbi:MAG TPA: energy transducer TonB, partial [Hyphomicrobiales bacterium]|nr:energy transducer TonB [Hyphomicrobiales bacterium]
ETPKDAAIEQPEPPAPPKKVEPKPEKKAAKAEPRAKSGKVEKRAGGGKAAASAGAGGGGTSREAGGKAAMSNYSGKVRSRIAGRARSPGGRGTVTVRFTVTASGSVSSASVVQSSGSRNLDRAAIVAVKRGFPPIPPGLPRQITFTLPIRFR